MKYKFALCSIAILLILTMIQPIPVSAQPQSRPRMDTKYMKMYYSRATEWSGLKAGDIDVMDFPLSAAQFAEWAWWPLTYPSQPSIPSRTNPANGIAITVEGGVAPHHYRDLGVFAFDMNNNYYMEGLPGAIYSYPGIPSPTGDVNFRRAIAWLVDKVTTANLDFQGTLQILDVPLTKPVHELYINPSVVWGPFNPIVASGSGGFGGLLDGAGYIQDFSASNPYYDSSKPWSAKYYRKNPFTGTVLDPLVFYIRGDISELTAAGIRFRDNLRIAGIPVNGVVVAKETAFLQVNLFGYHLYTSYRRLEVDVDHLHDWYTYEFAKSYDYNYMIHNAYYGPGVVGPSPVSLPLESQLDQVKNAPTKSLLITAAQNVQTLLFDLHTGTIPSIILGRYKPMFTAYLTGWRGIVNEEGRGVKNWYTGAMAYKTGVTALKVGLHNVVEKLNPVTAWSEENIDFADWNTLWEIYDPLIRLDPYNPHRYEVPLGLADNWKAQTVLDPVQSKSVTMLTFHLRTNAYWHDGSPVTTADVQFSIDYHKASMGTFYSDVMHVNRVDIGTSWFQVYMDDIYALALHWVGGVPIIKMNIWQLVPDPFVYDPEVDDINGNGIVDLKEDGSGPWVFDSKLVDDYVNLNANTNWYLTTGPDNPITTNLYDPGDVERCVMEAFHRVGDLDYNAIVDVIDLSLMSPQWSGLFFPYQSPPTCWDDQYSSLIYSPPVSFPPDPYITGWAPPFDWIWHSPFVIGYNWYNGIQPPTGASPPFLGYHPWKSGDINYDNRVNLWDITTWSLNWFRRAGSGW